MLTMLLYNTATASILARVGFLAIRDDALPANHPPREQDLTLAHLAQTVSTYTQVTQNRWSESDTQAYRDNKISQVPVEKVRAVLQAVSDRTGARINSFNYFIKEILTLVNPKSPAQQKRALGLLVRRVRELHAGSADYSLANFAHDVKTACAREGVAFDNDLLNELLS
jgi:hypothetical protein